MHDVPSLPDPLCREEIGVLTSLPLLRNVVEDLEAARNNGQSSLTLYFTKESHIHTLMNLILAALPQANRRIPELDYAASTVILHRSRCIRSWFSLVVPNIRVVRTQ